MARAQKKTSFDEFVDEQMQDASFVRGFTKARRTIDAIDGIVRALDMARIDVGMTKTELARRISAKPELVRRLLTAKSPNPTLETVVRIAHALGLSLRLVPEKPSKGRAA